jgi:electron transfer flavoprotein beta subunit
MSSNVIACFKWVYDEADVAVDAKLTPDFSRARSKISEYDRNAIAEAVQVAAKIGGMPLGLTLGSSAAAAGLKDALSRGLEEVYLIDCGAEAQSDYCVVTEALAKAIQTMPEVGLVVCAEGSSDRYGRQTASRLGAVLDWPTVTGVVAIETDGTALKVRRKLENSFEALALPLPAVVAVLPEINQPDLPGMKAILAAKKKPQHTLEFASLGVDATSAVTVTAVTGLQNNRKQLVFDGPDEAANVAEFVAALRKEGTIS